MTKRPSMHSDKNWVKSNWYPLIVGATAAFVVVLGFIFIDSTEDAAFKARERIDITERVGHISDAVKSVFSIHLGALNALEGLVKTRPNLTQDVFKGVAMALVQGHPAIRQIQLSPDAIVTYLHPTDANDKARGLDLRSLPTQRVAVEQTIRDGLIKTVGPLTLAQGGRALITRKPIYIGNGKGRRFWGFATIILDFPKLLKELQASLDSPYVDVVIKLDDADGRRGQVIFGDQRRLSPNQDVMAKIDLPGTRWVLAVAPRNGWASHRPGRWFLLVVGFLMSVLCGALAYWDAARRIALKSAEQEVKAQKEKLAKKSSLLETTFDNMAQGIAVYDADYNLVSFSERFSTIFGFPPGFLHHGMSIDEMVRQRHKQGHYKEDIDEITGRRRQALALMSERSGERTLPNGTVVAYHRQPMPGGGCVTTHTDITRERRFEEDLRHAKEQAESANRSKSEFVALMSHELRTPLTAIIGFSEALMKKIFGPVGNTKNLEYIEDINASGHHLLGLINDILDVSKIEAGKVELYEEAFDPAGIVRSCLSLVKGQARSQGIALVAELPDCLLPLYADQRILKQIILNLLSNAIKFTPEGGKVTLKMWSQPGTGHVLQVIDTGIGVALNDIPKILKPFTQVEGDLSRKHQGTGLGLPLCKNLIELHGGYLDFQSEVEVGSTVTVRFPKERVVTSRVIPESSVAV